MSIPSRPPKNMSSGKVWSSVSASLTHTPLAGGRSSSCNKQTNSPPRHSHRSIVGAYFINIVTVQQKVIRSIEPGFPICLPQMAPLYTREPPSARNPVRRTIVQLQRPSPQPTLTWNRPEPLLSGHFSDTAPHLCPFFASLRCTRPRVSLPAPAAPRSSAASRRRAAGSDDLPPAGASSIWRASPAGPQFSPAAAGDSSATSA